MIALREWSRLAEELQQERPRLSNRIRQQLWRCLQLLEVSDDVSRMGPGSRHFAPTPAKAARGPSTVPLVEAVLQTGELASG